MELETIPLFECSPKRRMTVRGFIDLEMVNDETANNKRDLKFGSEGAVDAYSNSVEVDVDMIAPSNKFESEIGQLVQRFEMFARTCGQNIATRGTLCEDGGAFAGPSMTSSGMWHW